MGWHQPLLTQYSAGWMSAEDSVVITVMESEQSNKGRSSGNRTSPPLASHLLHCHTEQKCTGHLRASVVNPFGIWPSDEEGDSMKRGEIKAGSETLYLCFLLAREIDEFFRKCVLLNKESWDFVMLVLLKRYICSPGSSPWAHGCVLEMLTASHFGACVFWFSCPPGSFLRPPQPGRARVLMTPETTLQQWKMEFRGWIPPASPSSGE